MFSERVGSNPIGVAILFADFFFSLLFFDMDAFAAQVHARAFSRYLLLAVYSAGCVYALDVRGRS